MTAITHNPGAPALNAGPGLGARIWRVVRLNLVNKWTTIWLPVMIMFFIWLVNWLIWWIIWGATEPADRATAIASAFAASLELAREGQVELRQDGAFEPIFMRRGKTPLPRDGQ